MNFRLIFSVHQIILTGFCSLETSFIIGLNFVLLVFFKFCTFVRLVCFVVFFFICFSVEGQCTK